MVLVVYFISVKRQIDGIGTSFICTKQTGSRSTGVKVLQSVRLSSS